MPLIFLWCLGVILHTPIFRIRTSTLSRACVIVLGNLTDMPQEDLYSQFTYHMLSNNIKTAYACGNKLSFCLEQYLQQCENCSQPSHYLHDDGFSAASSCSRTVSLSALLSRFYLVLQQEGDFTAIWALCRFMLWRRKSSLVLLPWFGLKKLKKGAVDE